MTTTEMDAPAGRRIRLPLPNLDPASPALTWIGLGIAALGFAVIAFSWGKVAALLDVSLQLPYVVSGGLTGLALVVVGMTGVNVAARRQDGAERAREVEALQAVLRLPSAIVAAHTSYSANNLAALAGYNASLRLAAWRAAR